MFLHHGLNSANLIAQRGSLLKTQRLCSLFHLILQTGDNTLRPPLQELAQIGDHLPVANLIDFPNTRRVA